MVVCIDCFIQIFHKARNKAERKAHQQFIILQAHECSAAVVACGEDRPVIDKC